jgi:hypothetical protein
VTVPLKNANGGVSTVEPGMGILKANIRRCDWNVNAIQWERLHASAEYIPEGVMWRDADQVPAHRTTQIPKVNNI